ncbi:putative oxidoreductase [Helianthus annuus]|nr:putative oxidoreductase [Helianthus annuus]
MASAAFTMANSSLQVNAKGFSEFSGLRTSSLPIGRKGSDDLVSLLPSKPLFKAEGCHQWVRSYRKELLEVLAWAEGFSSGCHCINDTGGVKQASHLLKYDSTLGIFDADVKPAGDNGISVDGKIIKVVSDRNPSNLPWGELGIDLVIEGTGVFVDREGAGKHIEAGAKKVLITAPGKGDIPTYVVGVNAELYNHPRPSSATPPAPPTASLLSSKSSTKIRFACSRSKELVWGPVFSLNRIIKGTMTTTHSYTGDQRLLDASHRDLRRARAAALNIVPTSTGAAKAVALVLPSLKGKLNGIALRVPTPNVSVVDLVVQVSKKTFAEEVNAAFREAADNELNGILSVCDEPLVSVDFRCSDVSSTVDSSLTMVMGDDMVKVIAWYDNEWGYSQRVVDLADIVANNWK